MRARRLALLGAAGAAAVVAAHGSAQPQTTVPTVVVPIRITLTDSAFLVSPKTAPRAALGRFILDNRGTKRHAFKLEWTRTAYGVQKGFTKALMPGKRAEVLLYLDYRGRIGYRGSLPADRSKASMKGFIRVY